VIKETSQQDQSREMRRRLTERQIKRRLQSDGGIGSSNNTIKINDKILHFGSKSFVSRDDGGLIIRIDKKDLYSVSMAELQRIFEVAKSPIVKVFQNPRFSNNIPIQASNPKMLHFGIWMNNVTHYSGGRVSILYNAHMLAAMGHKVTIVTDMMPPFINDMKDIPTEGRVQFVHGSFTMKSNWLLKNIDNNFDVVICTPRIYEGFAYAEKFNLPCHAIIFETPNYISQFRGGADSTEDYWREYKMSIINFGDGVLCHPGTTMNYCKEWLKDFDGVFNEFSPPINTYAADNVEAVEENEIVFIGRMLEYKCPDDIVKAVATIPAEIRPAINFIGSHSEMTRQRIIQKGLSGRVDVHFYANITDAEKYYLIKRAKMLVIPTKFEGFGMPPAEALYCRKPVICYDIPITRYIYGDTVNYVEIGNIKKLGKAIKNLLNNPEKCAVQGETGYRAMFNKDTNIPCLPMKIKDNLRKVFYGEKYPKITAGIIVLNGIDTIDKCIASIYDAVDKIIIIEGAIAQYAGLNMDLVSSNGHSIDGTYDYLKNLDDPANKIEVVTKDGCWKHKAEMQNEIAKRIMTELYLKVDADEIWKESDIEYGRRLFMLDKTLCILKIKMFHFWKNLDTIAVGGQWESLIPRMWRWNKSFHHDESDPRGFNYFIDELGKKVADPEYKIMNLMLQLCYHLGYCRDDEQIRGKINYYKNRGIEVNVKDNYTNWVPGQPTSSTHPDGTGTAKFIGILPKVLQPDYGTKIKVLPKEVMENNQNMLNANPKPAESKGVENGYHTLYESKG
jgi:glycosyltransferase involved in cell wall biosynthesis